MNILNKDECHQQRFYYVEAARRYTNARNNMPIELTDSFEEPKIVGESYYFSNKNGDVIDYPNAYAKKGFSSMIYNNSTLRIKVGKLWCGKGSSKFNIIR